MEHGMLGQYGTMERGKIPPYLQRCLILPQCPGAFYPTPIPPTKILVTKVIKRF